MSAGDDTVSYMKRRVAEAIIQFIRANSLTQCEAANLCNMQLHKFSLDFLIKVDVDLTGRPYSLLAPYHSR